MYFYVGSNVVFLFSSWMIMDNAGLFFVACLATFLLAVAYHYVAN